MKEHSVNKSVIVNKKGVIHFAVHFRILYVDAEF